MIDGILAIFEKFPFSKWAAIVGFGLLFFGDKDWKQIGLWIVGGVIIFMIGLYWLIMDIEETDKEFRRRNDSVWVC